MYSDFLALSGNICSFSNPQTLSSLLSRTLFGTLSHIGNSSSVQSFNPTSEDAWLYKAKSITISSFSSWTTAFTSSGFPYSVAVFFAFANSLGLVNPLVNTTVEVSNSPSVTGSSELSVVLGNSLCPKSYSLRFVKVSGPTSLPSKIFSNLCLRFSLYAAID